MQTKTIKVSAAVHRKLRDTADQYGMKAQALADRVLGAWMDGRSFRVPRIVPCGTAPRATAQEGQG